MGADSRIFSVYQNVLTASADESARSAHWRSERGRSAEIEAFFDGRDLPVTHCPEPLAGCDRS